MSKNVKLYSKEGIEYAFNFTFFNDIFRRTAKENGDTLGDLEEKLSAAIYVEKSTIHAWRFKKNAPGDLDKIDMVAEFFHIDPEFLLVETVINIGEKDMNSLQNNTQVNVRRLSDREKESFKKVYLEFLKYIKNVEQYYDNFISLHEELNHEIESQWIHWPYPVEEIKEDNYPSKEAYEEDCFEREMSKQAITELKSDILESRIKTNYEHVSELDTIKNILIEERIDIPVEIFDILNEQIEQFESVMEIINSDFWFVASVIGFLADEDTVDKGEDFLKCLTKYLNDTDENNPSSLKLQLANELKRLADFHEIYANNGIITVETIAEKLVRAYKKNEENTDEFYEFRKRQKEYLKSAIGVFHETIGSILGKYQ